jgi:hypothetical protein
LDNANLGDLMNLTAKAKPARDGKDTAYAGEYDEKYAERLKTER